MVIFWLIFMIFSILPTSFMGAIKHIVLSHLEE